MILDLLRLLVSGFHFWLLAYNQSAHQPTLASKGGEIITQLPLESLGNGIPVVTREMIGFYIQNCMVCFETAGHTSGVTLFVNSNDKSHEFEVVWKAKITEAIRRAYADLIQATFHAGSAIALLLTRELSEYTGYEQAVLGTTIDYWLVKKDAPEEDHLIFNHAGRLEASGILQERGTNTVDGRIADKLERLDRTTDIPAIIVVVEFGTPKSRMVVDG